MFKILKLLAKNDNRADISFIDVKELYDLAYAEKARARVNLKRYKMLISKAVKLDEAYCAQLELVAQKKYGRAA